MASRAEVIEIARRWIGTPFRHRGRTLGIEVDCAGIVVGTGRMAGLTKADELDYSKDPQSDRMRAVLDRHLIRVPFVDMMPADVLWFAFDKDPQHLGIYTGRNLIHAYARRGECVEHILDRTWAQRIRAVYRYPGLD